MGWGDALIDAGSGISSIVDAFDKQKTDEEKQQLLIQQQKRQAIADALSARVSNAQLDRYAQEDADKKAAAERLTLGNTVNASALGSIASGDYRNPATQIADPELEKEKAITAATTSSPFAQVAKPAGFNGANISPFDTVAANKSVMGSIGNQGLGKLQQQVRDTTPSQYYRGKAGEYADNPAVKENLADFEKQDENAAARAEKARLESEVNKYKSVDDARAQSTLEETMRHNRATESLTNQGKSGAGGAMRGPGATVISKLNSNADYKAQNLKVSNATHAMTLINQMQNEDGGFDATKPQAAELAMTMANLVSGSGSHTVEEFKSMNQQSLMGSLVNNYNKLTGSNLNTLPKDWANMYKETIGRQGAVAQTIRDGYVDPVVDAVTAGNTDETQRETIRGAVKHMGVNFLDKYPEYDPDKTSSPQPSGGGTASGFSVTAPNGKTYKFNNQNDLNAFKQKAGL